MKKLNTKAMISVLLSLVIALSCFVLTVSAAAAATVVKAPDKTTFYQGIDWAYNKAGKITGTCGDFDISGTVLSYKSQEVKYAIDKWPNMSIRPADSAWKVGVNTAKIYCDEFPSSVYATLNINIVAVESISVITPPTKTILIQDTDWVLSGLGDVEFTSFDMTGTRLSVKYTDNTTKIISYPENLLIGWAVPLELEYYEPGVNTLYATFCGKRAPFTVNFVKKGEKLPGDVNQDYKINSFDALLVLQYAVGSTEFNNTQIAQADVDKNSKVNSADALLILQYAVGKITSF